MEYQAKLTYDVSLLRKAVFAFWRRTIGVGFPLAWLVVGISFVYLVIGGESSWVVGVMGTILALAALFVLTIYVVHFRRTMQKFSDMGEPHAELQVNDSSFSVASGAGNATLPWSSVEELWCFSKFWLFLFSKSQFMTLPVDSCSPELLEFIIKKVDSSGGRVVGASRSVN
jgi:hypothetical protein